MEANNRRDFLKKAALAGASALMAPTLLAAEGKDESEFVRLSLKPWGIALKFLFLHHENILFPND